MHIKKLLSYFSTFEKCLWLASITFISYLPMVFCFIAFLINDLYGFFNWQKMQRRQRSGD